MPVRVALNVVYSMVTRDMDAKQHRDFDGALYGFTASEAAANRALNAPLVDEPGGGES
jgi:hypothetical protein